MQLWKYLSRSNCACFSNRSLFILALISCICRLTISDSFFSRASLSANCWDQQNSITESLQVTTYKLKSKYHILWVHLFRTYCTYRTSPAHTHFSFTFSCTSLHPWVHPLETDFLAGFCYFMIFIPFSLILHTSLFRIPAQHQIFAHIAHPLSFCTYRTSLAQTWNSMHIPS